MPRLVITIVLTFLLERAASQDPATPSPACMNATSQQTSACVNITGANICSGVCGTAIQAVLDNCAPEVSYIIYIWPRILAVDILNCMKVGSMLFRHALAIYCSTTYIAILAICVWSNNEPSTLLISWT